MSDNLMKCENCGTDHINKYCVETWDVANCPICGADLKEQISKQEVAK